jgi:hypothetical protein
VGLTSTSASSSTVIGGPGQTVPYSTKRYIPDFTFDSLGLAVEIKLCNRPGREKEIIDEINSDIVGYQSSYERILFVIYDLGFISGRGQVPLQHRATGRGFGSASSRSSRNCHVPWSGDMG